MRVGHLGTIAVLLSAVVQIGCDGTHSPVARDTTKLLARYYDTITSATVDSGVHYAAYTAVLEIPQSAEVQLQYASRLTALTARRSAAHDLADAVMSLDSARGNRAAADNARDAGERLGQAIKNLPAMPGITSSVTSTAGATVAKLLLWRGMNEAGRELTGAAAALARGFTNERPAYDSIVRDRDNRAKNLLKLLTDRGLVSTAAHTEDLHLGVAWKSTSDPAVTTIGLSIARFGLDRATLAMECATRETDAALQLLISAPKSGDIPRSVRRANECLDQYEQNTK